MHAIQLKVQQLADPEPAGPLQQQCAAGQLVRRGAQRPGQPPVGVDGKVTRQDFRQLGDVAREDQPAA